MRKLSPLTSDKQKDGVFLSLIKPMKILVENIFGGCLILAEIVCGVNKNKDVNEK